MRMLGGVRFDGAGARHRLIAAVGALMVLGFCLSAGAVEKDLTTRGEALVREHCSRCHAVGKEGASPHEEALPFRTLSSKYPVGDLAESLAEGIVAGHPDMPILVFNAPDVEAIITYLESIQDAPAETSEPAEPLAALEERSPSQPLAVHPKLSLIRR
jgi:mono/diheme cytochrome c family protein